MILRLYEVFENQNTTMLVTELCAGRELSYEIQLRESFSELETAIVMRQLLEAIQFCHVHNVAHRDIKPDNIVIDKESQGAIKLVDFSAAQPFNQGGRKLKQMQGKAEFTAPEVIKGRYDERCDVWSAGIVMFNLLSGKIPFEG